MLRYKHLSKLVVLLNFVAHKTSSRLAYFVSIKFVQTTTVLICRANWASAAMALVHLHSDMEDAGVWSPDNVRLSFLHGNPMLKYVTFSVFGQIHLDIYIFGLNHIAEGKKSIFTSPFKWIVPLWPGSLPYPGKHFQHGGPNREIDLNPVCWPLFDLGRPIGLWAEGWHYCRRDK